MSNKNGLNGHKKQEDIRLKTADSIIEAMKTDAKLKEKFIVGLNKLGFPLEFQVRKFLIEKGYRQVNKCNFTIKIDDEEIIKSYDIMGLKELSKTILRDVQIVLTLQLIGECKYSSERGNILFIIPDKSNFENEFFIGPLLTNLEAAYYSSHQNRFIISKFIEEFGDIPIASDIRDENIESICSNEGDSNKRKNRVPEYERIYNIVEETILPACSENFIDWRRFYYNLCGKNFRSEDKNKDKQIYINEIEKQSYFSHLIIPFIVTSKKLLSPRLDENWNIIDFNEEKYLLYRHSVKRLNEYHEIMNGVYDFGVFICNEKYFDEFINFIEKIFEKIFQQILHNIEFNPFKLSQDIVAIEDHNKRIEQVRGKGYLN